MNLTRTNLVLGGLLVMTIALTMSMEPDYTILNVEFIPNMRRSPASDAYAANSVLPHARTMQAPVHGTIARGDLPLYFEATKEDAVRAGEELQNPFAFDEPDQPIDSTPEAETDATLSDQKTASIDPQPNIASEQKELTHAQKLDASVQRGAKVYGVFCVSCHGPGGAGDGPVTKRGFPPPPPLPTGKSVQMKDGQLFHILTYGQGSMSSMSAQLNRNRRWDVINYIRSLQAGAAMESQQPATPVTDDSPEAKQETEKPPKAAEDQL